MFLINPKRTQQGNLTTEVIPLMYGQDKSSTLRSTSSPQYERREDIANVRRRLV